MTDAETIQAAYEDELRRMYKCFDADYSLAKMWSLKLGDKNVTAAEVLEAFRRGLALAREIRDVLLKEVSDVR